MMVATEAAAIERAALMRQLAHSGEPAAALAYCRALCRALAAELVALG